MANNKALVITSWGVVSSQGIGKRAFADSLANKRRADSFRIESFHAADYVGRKGTRVYDRITQFTVVATHEALQDARANLPECGERRGFDEAGFVLASTFGGLKSNSDFMKEVLQEKPNRIDGSAFPSAVMNYAAGQAAIRFGLKGVNATISGGRLASLQAMQYAVRCLKTGKSKQIFVGGAEERSEYLDWGFRQAGRDSVKIGEGSAVVLVETLDSAQENHRKPLVRVIGCSTRILSLRYSRNLAQEYIDSLANCIRTVLAQEQVTLTASNTLVMYSSGKEDDMRFVEEEALSAAIGALSKNICIKDQLGDCYSAMGMFQLAAFLAQMETGAETGGKDAPQYAILLSVEEDGMVGCAIIESIN